MTVRFHLLDAYDEIPAPLRDAIRRDLDHALVAVGACLAVDRVDVVVAASRWVIPEYGLGGRTEGKGRVTLTVDPDSPRVADPDRAIRLRGVLAHELHHVMRGRGPGYGDTLGETLVSEGLAQCFEEEVGAPTPFYGVFLDAAALARVAAKAKDQVQLSRYDYDAWYFGRHGDAEWPRYAGYSLGYAMARGWLDANGTTASASAIVPAQDIVGGWQAGTFELCYPTF